MLFRPTKEIFLFQSIWKSLLTFALVIFSFFWSLVEGYGQIAQRGASTFGETPNNANNNALTIPKPAGVVSGDVLIANIVQNESDNDNGGLSAANLAGWILIDGRIFYSQGTDNGDNAWFETVLYRIADGTEGANFTFNLPNSRADGAVGSIMAFSGVDVTGGFDSFGTPNSGPFDLDPGILNVQGDSDNDISTGSGITTATDNAAVIMLAQTTDNITFDHTGGNQWRTANDGNLTEILDENTSRGDDASIGAAWTTKTIAGDTGIGEVRISNNQRWASMLLALRPACFPPSIASQSTAAQTVSCGDPSFSAISVTASGVGLSYQWYETTTAVASGGTPAGTDSPSFTPSPPLDGNGYYYYVVVSSSCGTVTSAISGEFTRSENQVEYNTPGLQTFYVPAGVTSIIIEAWGAGGGGGGRSGSDGGAGGGGGGAYSRSTFEVRPGEPIAVYVGNGGIGSNSSNTSRPDGESTWISRTNTQSDAMLLAVGGESVDNNILTGGHGGQSSSGIGTFLFSGGDGSDGTDGGSGFGGGGGSSAGSSSDGNNATDQTGASAPTNGGNGGDGRTRSQNTNGLSGTIIPGGGGGGAGRNNGNRTGGSGNSGKVVITYSCVSYPPCSNVIDDGAISGTTILEFTADCTWDAPEGLLEFEVLVIGGGGGGGVRSGGGGGGGGAIHARANIETITSSGLPAGTSYSIDVGDGGTGSTDRNQKGVNGTESRFDFGGDYEIIAGGGGGGGSDGSSSDQDGASGSASSYNSSTAGFSIPLSINYEGSGGGGSHDGDGGSGHGNGGDADSHSGGGGSGLSGNNGQDAPNNDDGGDGANGRQFSNIDISLNRYFGAGGGGGGRDNVVGVGGSSSSGGDGGIDDGNNATDGEDASTPGSGGGGSGHDEDTNGGNGAKGVVFVSYPNFRILSVEYLYFNAKYNSFLRSGDLTWATAKEWENDRFEVERSVNDVTSWEKIGVIDGAGYSDGSIEYDYQDLKLPPAGGDLFYRLKQVDFDGDSTYSDTKAIKVESLSGSTKWRVFPNPTTGYPLSVELLDRFTYRDEPVMLRVIAPTGQYKLIQVDEIRNLGTQVSEYFENKAPGVYTIEISWGQNKEYHKVILRR